LLIDQAWLGHAAQGAGLRGVTMIFAYGVHVVAAAAWLGSLPPLLLALSESRGFAPEMTPLLLSRYSRLALAAVLLLVAGGLANVGFRAGCAIGRLFAGEYGHLLALKAGLFASMLCLAAFNRLIAMPGLPGRAAALRRSVALELALGVLVLAVTAALGVTPPP
jgi:putative copper resistance protein D